MTLQEQLEPTVQQVVDFVFKYDQALRDLLGKLPDEPKRALIRFPNPHIATGPTLIHVCSDGAIVLFKNLLPPTAGGSAPPVEVMVHRNPGPTVVEFYNANAQNFFTFVDPISKLVSYGHTAQFDPNSDFSSNLCQILVSDFEGSYLLPLFSKIFIVGWPYVMRHAAKPSLLAEESLVHGFANANLENHSKAISLVAEFRSLVDSATVESDIQAFLEKHPELIFPEFEKVIAKPQLGGEREPDFAFALPTSAGMKWAFVEIESPTKKIFTSQPDFQFRAEFTQAKGQLLQWEPLITRDHAYFERRFHGLFKPEYHLVYGRDSELDDRRRDMLVAEFSATSNRFFHTFDDLANRFERIIRRVFR